MRSLTRTASLCAMTAALAVSALAAQSYTNPKFGYRMSYPDGWTVEAVPADPGNVIGGTAEGNVIVVCVTTASDSPETAGFTQDQINKAMSTPIGRDTWRSSLPQEFEKLEFQSDGVRLHPSGLMAQEAVFSYVAKDIGPERVKMVFLLLNSPKVNYTTGCLVDDKNYDAKRTVIRQVIDSFRTKEGPGGLSVDANPQGPSAVIPAASSGAPMSAPSKDVIAKAAALAAARFKN